MTNYEFHKDKIINLIIGESMLCSDIWQMRTGRKQPCPYDCRDDKVCNKCEQLSKEWLNANFNEINILDLFALRGKDKIRMTKKDTKRRAVYEVVYKTPTHVWLHYDSEANGEYGTDEDFLLPIEDMYLYFEDFEMVYEYDGR